MIAETLLSMTLMALASGAPPQVNYATRAETQSWEPIALKKVEKIVESAALSHLSKGGVMRLKKTRLADVRKGEYSLIIQGRFIDEAERFAVYFSFGAGTRDDVPDFFVTDTSEPLGRMKRSKMQKRIQAAAVRAAKRLEMLLTPRLRSIQMKVDLPPIDDESLPLSWGSVDIPNVKDKRKAIRDLLNVRNEDSVRYGALKELKGLVFDQKPVRNALELCVLRDPTPGVRSSCVQALAPKARDHVPTQRILLHAMRREVDEKVLSSLTSASSVFVGLSRSETIATWLQLIARDATPPQSHKKLLDLIAKEERVPNLDVAIAACLNQEALVYGKRRACAGRALHKLSPARQKAATWEFFKGLSGPLAQTGEGAFSDMEGRTLSRRKEEIDRDITALLFDLSLSDATPHQVRRKSIYLVARNIPPTPDNLKRMGKLLAHPIYWDASLGAIREMTSRNKALMPFATAIIQNVEKSTKFLERPHRAHANKKFKETLDRWKRAAERRKKSR